MVYFLIEKNVISGTTMNRIYYIAFCLLILLTSSSVLAVTLKWEISVNERLEVVRTAKVKYLVNSRLVRIFEERNIIDLTCYEKEGKSSRVKGVFSIFKRRSGENVFQLQKQYLADFLINPSGRYHVSAEYFVPNLRHIPTFPGKDVKPGDNWSEPAELLLNNFSVPLKLMLTAEYTLVSINRKNGRDIAVINYHYLIDKDLTGRPLPRDFPLKIYGQNMGTILWDITRNRPVDMNDRYRIMFVFRKGNRGYGSIEFKMNIESKPKMYSSLTPEQKEKARKELQDELPDNSDIKVDTDKRGLVIRLGEVLFDFNSHNLKKDARKTLNSVIDIIKKKYPDREIIVEGHSDNTGNRNYNRKLSVRRARSAAEYLKSGVGHDKFSYRGFGPDKPISDNRTKEGRQKNRRVEVIIKLN